MPHSDNISISLIIPVHYGGANFQRCLTNLSAIRPLLKEIIVVADGETDSSWRLAEEAGIQVIKIPSPKGPAAARNLGAQKATGDILFFLDADVAVSPDAVDHILLAFQRPGLTAVFGSYDDEPFEPDFFSQHKNLFHHYVHQTAKEEASTFWGACGAIRRDIFMEAGGFDEKYRHPSIEDIELGYRLKRAGYKIRLLKDLKVKHLKRWDIITLLKTDFFYRALPWIDLILSRGRLIDDLNLKISNRISVLCIYLLLPTLFVSFFIPWFLIPSIVFLIVILTINREFYIFLYNKRGPGFVFKSIFWHWFYFFYCGLAFLIGLARHQFEKSIS